MKTGIRQMAAAELEPEPAEEGVPVMKSELDRQSTNRLQEQAARLHVDLPVSVLFSFFFKFIQPRRAVHVPPTAVPVQ